MLGPVEVRVSGQAIGMGGPRQRAVLAALAADLGRPVPVETLIDRVWGERPPERPRPVVHVYMARIRGAMRQAGADPQLVHRAGGYALELPDDRVDVHRFGQLVERARAVERDDAEQARLLRQALDLWTGVPLSGVPGEWAARMREAWERQRVDAVLRWARAELRRGRPAEVLDELSDLVARNPLSEAGAATLMQALRAAGRGADALLCYVGIRSRLADELGCDPGPELQELHVALLRETADPAVRTGTVEAPAQLSSDVRGFVNRRAELARLNATLPAPGTPPTAAATATIMVVSGMAGVGKTALAIHWAHRVRRHFPDGQLYLNLRGFDPAGPMTAAQATRTLLDTLGVAGEQVPHTMDAQVGLLRSLLSGRRMLILLDNARDADQVRPLLPGAPDCLVVVTSRNPLRGLVATEGAAFLAVDPLGAEEARALLARRLGERRTASERAAVDEIIQRCGGLPLAVAVVAARAAIHSDFPLASLASELSTRTGRLDALAGGDPTTDVRTVLSWSYRALSTPAARLFRLSGLHPGPDISAPAAASLLGVSVVSVGPLIRELADAHLFDERKPGRYASHDLLRAYATELAYRHERSRVRDAAMRRMVSHYLHAAYAADRLLYPQREAIALGPPGPGTTLERLDDYDAALAWLIAEHPVLLRVVQQAATAGCDDLAWRLAWALESFFQRRGHWHDQLSCQRAALTAATREGDPAGTAQAHRGLANAYARLGDHARAATHYRSALAGFTDLGDQVAQARIRLNIGLLAEWQGRYRDALRHARQALAIFEAVGDRAGQANSLNAIGYLNALLGDYPRSLEFCERALALHQELGDRLQEAATWDSLGYAHHHQGEHRQAIACYQLALDLARALGHRYDEAQALTHLGDVYQVAEGPEPAGEAWRAALEILTHLGHADADQIRERLRRLEAAPAPDESGLPGTR